MTIDEFASAVASWVRRYDTASVVSWYRSPGRDRSVGGGGASAHTQVPGAVDVVYWPANTNVIERMWPENEADMANEARRYGLRLKRFHAGRNFPKHDHLEPWDWSGDEGRC